MNALEMTAGTLVLAVSMTATAFGQAPQQSTVRPKVEVVSIKPSPVGKDIISARLAGQRIVLEDYPLRQMVQAAYGVRSSELFGGPPWIASTRYDVSAKAEKPVDNRALWRMMQSVLEDRFKLKIHHEQREFPVFNLVFAKPGKLPASRDGSCIEYDAAMPPPPASNGKPPLPRCGAILMGPAQPIGMKLSGLKVRMPELAQRLTDILGRHVIDKTGFTGAFDLDVKFAADEAIRGLPSRSQADVAESPADPSGMPSIFTVLRNQLGLKLDSGKALVDVLAIDNIERPSAN